MSETITIKSFHKLVENDPELRALYSTHMHGGGDTEEFIRAQLQKTLVRHDDGEDVDTRCDDSAHQSELESEDVNGRMAWLRQELVDTHAKKAIRQL